MTEAEHNPHTVPAARRRARPGARLDIVVGAKVLTKFSVCGGASDG